MDESVSFVKKPESKVMPTNNSCITSNYDNILDSEQIEYDKSNDF